MTKKTVAVSQSTYDEISALVPSQNRWHEDAGLTIYLTNFTDNSITRMVLVPDMKKGDHAGAAKEALGMDYFPDNWKVLGIEERGRMKCAHSSDGTIVYLMRRNSPGGNDMFVVECFDRETAREFFPGREVSHREGLGFTVEVK